MANQSETSNIEPESALPWYASGLRFSCVGCGDCCGREPGVVEFSPDEERSMADFLDITPEEFRITYTWQKYGVLSLRERENYDCVFLHRQQNCVRCKIYPVRPEQCRSFPFWPEILKNKLEWDKYSLLCPGMNRGPLHKFLEIN
ncbi:MAG: YkgJ family cysteine cluster protein [Synergistaceae bacterium]|jgi:Fe-S-cluster containining protein|nr:YkgJ family cysteine cluster protein [Synergistaceae bacterium]